VSGRRLLIVNADDYGLTPGVSRGILTAHREGIVTSTSVIAIGPAFEQWAPALRDTPGIGIGAHLAVVGEDPPLLSRREVPTLVDRHGRLPRSWRQLLPRVALGRIDLDDLRREFQAQIGRLMGARLPLTHVDTHQHVHLWPSVAGLVLDLAEEFGIGNLRIIRSSGRSPVGRTVQHLGRALEGRASARGLHFPATAAGLDEAGRLSADRLCEAIALLERSPGDSAELTTHPGEELDPDRSRYRWGYRWASELAGLTSPVVRHSVDRAGFQLGTFADLAAE